MSLKLPHIRIQHHPVSLFQDEERISATLRGELIHSVFSLLDHVTGRGDIERAVQQAFALYGVDTTRLNIEEECSAPIARALALPQVQAWFAPGVLNRRELEVVDAQGEVLRIDRLVIDNDMLTVIDFKMGKRERGHGEQVLLYRGLVQEICKRTTHGYILYIDEPAVVAVP
jgi:ATP-dependent exoDNAse (exonuclease V) beta subunit